MWGILGYVGNTEICVEYWDMWGILGYVGNTEICREYWNMWGILGYVGHAGICGENTEICLFSAVCSNIGLSSEGEEGTNLLLLHKVMNVFGKGSLSSELCSCSLVSSVGE